MILIRIAQAIGLKLLHPESVSQDCLRHHARAEMASGVDLPSWRVPADRLPLWDRTEGERRGA